MMLKRINGLQFISKLVNPDLSDFSIAPDPSPSRYLWTGLKISNGWPGLYGSINEPVGTKTWSSGENSIYSSRIFKGGEQDK